MAAASDQNTLVFVYLYGTVYVASQPAKPDITQLLVRRMAEIGGDATKAMKSIIVSAGSKN